MPGPYGLTPAGFNMKRQADIATDLGDSLRAELGDDLNLDPETSVAGVLVGVLSEPLAELWEGLAAAYDAFFPQLASGNSLDEAVSITGHARRFGFPSQVVLTLGADAGPSVPVPAGQVITHDATGSRWITTESVTIPGGGTIDATAESEAEGPITAAPGTLTVISSPIAGWTTVTNATEANPGRLDETDEQLLARRGLSLVIANAGSAEALRQAILKVDEVTHAVVRENRTNATDGNGLPPHSQNPIVLGGTDPEVAAAIYSAKSAGIETHGAVVVNVTDAEGNPQPIRFDRGAEEQLLLAVTVTQGPGWLGAQGVQAVKDALVAFVATLQPGADVLNWQLCAALATIPGIADVAILQAFDPTPPTSDANLPVGPTDRAKLDAADVAVTVI